MPAAYLLFSLVQMVSDCRTSLDKLLYAELLRPRIKRCTVCGAFFASKSNSVKYCPDCRKRITNRQTAERMRKRRSLLRDKGENSLDLQGLQRVKIT